MRLDVRAALLFTLFIISGCSGSSADNEFVISNTTVVSNVQNSQQPASTFTQGNLDKNANKNTDHNLASNMQPKTVRDFFMLLPEEYFLLEGCEPAKDKDCRKAKLDYLKTFAEIEDTANGYLKGGCDGAQSCLEMAIFKRPDGKYIVSLRVSQEMMDSFYFLNYENGKWTDVSTQVIPQFSKKNIYELPRNGTTVKVFAKKVIEKGADYEITEKGAKLYDLEWNNGNFSIKK